MGNQEGDRGNEKGKRGRVCEMCVKVLERGYEGREVKGSDAVK